MAAKPADFRVGALNKGTEDKGNVGRGWRNDDGTITIVLNPFVVLEASKALLITLFPEDKQ
jgi:hypothetical protein